MEMGVRTVKMEKREREHKKERIGQEKFHQLD
jgi:hypothetical protein